MVSPKGRATVPAEIRRALGLRSGDKLAFVVDGGEVKMVRKGSVVEGTAGMLKGRGPARAAERLREAAEKAIAEEADERAKG